MPRASIQELEAKMDLASAVIEELAQQLSESEQRLAIYKTVSEMALNTTHYHIDLANSLLIENEELKNEFDMVVDELQQENEKLKTQLINERLGGILSPRRKQNIYGF